MRATAIRHGVAVVVALAAAAATGCDSSSDANGPSDGPSRTAATAPSTPASSSSTSTGQGVALFADPPAATSSLTPDTSSGSILRSRYVTFRSDLLPATADNLRVSLAFFDDATFVGTIDHIDRQTLLTSWSGPIEGLPNSLFVVVQTDQGYQLTASTTQGTFAMTMTDDGFYQVAQVDQPDVMDGQGTSVPSSSASSG